jgi:hypothetical protein
MLGRLMGDLPPGVVMPGGLLQALWRGDFAQGLLHALSLLPTHVMPEQMVTDVAHAIRVYVLDCLGPSGRWMAGEGGDRESDYMGSLVLVVSTALAIAHHANLFGRPCTGPKRVGETMVDGALALARGLLSLRGFVQALLSRDRDIADGAIEALQEQVRVAREAYEASDNTTPSDTEGRRAMRHEYRDVRTRLEIAELDRSINSATDPNLISVLTADRGLLEENLRRQEPRTQDGVSSNAHRAASDAIPGVTRRHRTPWRRVWLSPWSSRGLVA